MILFEIKCLSIFCVPSKTVGEEENNADRSLETSTGCHSLFYSFDTPACSFTSTLFFTGNEKQLLYNDVNIEIASY